MKAQLAVSAQGFNLRGNDNLYKWYFNPALKVLLAKPATDGQTGSNNFFVKEPDYSKLLNTCGLDADKYDYVFDGRKTEHGIEFRLDRPDEAVLNDEVAEINEYTSLMFE